MEQYLYNEVYVVGTDVTISAGGDLVVCSSFEDLLNYLGAKNVSINSDLRVIHGVLTSAQSIPKDLKGLQPFILLKSPENDHGILFDADADDDCAELAAEIEKILESGEIASFFFEIDNVYILYGYELSLTLSVDEGDLAEEIISECLEVAEAARKLNTKDN